MCVINLHLKHELSRRQAPYVVYTKSLYWRLGLNVVVIVMGMLGWGTVLFAPICNTQGHLKNKICGVDSSSTPPHSPPATAHSPIMPTDTLDSAFLLPCPFESVCTFRASHEPALPITAVSLARQG